MMKDNDKENLEIMKTEMNKSKKILRRILEEQIRKENKKLNIQKK